MATFVIIQTAGDSGFDRILPERFGNSAMQLPKGEWLAAYRGASRQLCDELGINEQKTSSVIIFKFSSYWGRASRDIREWLEEYGGI
ncbi:MAG: hypothetical protein BECKG1743D_GA0114223_109252 [Candidatus Kentron sp. G]|nr:MAG: hypothetical protein BECKG1743F_GA0114225_111642 [Candidatus Kentron sp. G]VFN06732.1 MAG: hypothetical protein BECKG1743E_GA0114224_110622 [Candidatus Kentron sp. G]VFN06843.1 MAG: hypothetical protein BECKG1743D_GA0114223_109252 [Candidatus Kentron sp. G]